MANAPIKSYQTDADHGPELPATEARAGERKGLYRVLALSTLLALIVMAAVWLAVGATTHHVSPQTGPQGAAPASSSQ